MKFLKSLSPFIFFIFTTLYYIDGNMELTAMYSIATVLSFQINNINL